MTTHGIPLVVVLGMHRSGTSAVAKGLQVLGVDLGDRLMPPAPDNNEKGFFEDIDANAINVDLYRSLGQGQDWHTLATVPADELLSSRYASIRLRAIELLRSRMRNVPAYGLKDPRMSRLLPFWQDVFRYLNLDVRYVIVLRNPLSVARSLAKRDGLAPEKSHYLWLEHMVPSVTLTAGAPRVVVDYDLLMSDPRGQIGRINGALKLEHGIDLAQLDEYCGQFLEDRLRHATFAPEDLREDPLVPEPVRTAVAFLTDVAADKIGLESPNVSAAFRTLSAQLDSLSPAMNYVLRLENGIAGANRSLLERDGRIEGLEKLVHDKDVHIANLDRAVRDKDVHIANLDRALHDKDAHIQNLMGAERDRNAHILNLTQAVHDKDTHIGNIERASAEKDARIHDLTEAARKNESVLQEIGIRAVQVNHRLHRTRTSLAWRLAAPLRWIERAAARNRPGLPIDLVPFNQLQAERDEWRATGDDAQFLLIAEREWNVLSGWYDLEFEFAAAQPLKAQIFFSTGEGFDPSRSINVELQGHGRQGIPLCIPPNCTAVRLDPCDTAAVFRLSAASLRKRPESAALPPEFLAQSPVYEALRGESADKPVLRPMNVLGVSERGEFEWRSEGDDPWFLVEDVAGSLEPGWNVIELRIRANNDRGLAKLYFDYGQGFSELDSVGVPFASGQTAERYYRLKAVPRRVRVDPLEASGWFSFEHLRIRSSSRETARRHMLQRIAERAKQWKSLTPDGIWPELEREAGGPDGAEDLLVQEYNKTFPVIYGPRGPVSYSDWIAKFETGPSWDAAAIAARARVMESRPLISVIMPTYNTEEAFLRRAIDSVLAQSYSRWELCVADDASTEPHVRALLDEYREKDARIKILLRPENGHISAASNSALSLATGDYVALLDHDDELSPHALYFVAEAIGQNPGAQILYSDEDKIDETGYRTDPHFKPDWNPDLFFSQNYVSHLGVYRRELMMRVGGFRLGVEGSQDQDLFLRCLPHAGNSGIVHIPKVLYHWRMFEGSTALRSGEKSYTEIAGRKVLQSYFESQGRGDVVVEEGLEPNTYRIRHPIPKPEPLVSLLIPTRDMLQFLEPCLQSILDKTSYRNYEIIVLDNGSSEPATLRYLDRVQGEDARVRVLKYPHPFNFSAINNFGVKESRGTLIGMVNNDIEVIGPDWLTEMVSHASRPEIGCVGAKLYYDDDTIQHAGVIVGLGGVAGHSHKHFPRASSGYFHRLNIVQNLSAVTAACLIVRKEIYERVGGLDAENLKIAFNDVDFCLKVREAGFRNLWTPYAELYHHESKSRGTENTPEKVERFNREIEFMKTKWGEKLQRDPCYSENLTVVREDFSLR